MLRSWNIKFNAIFSDICTVHIGNVSPSPYIYKCMNKKNNKNKKKQNKTERPKKNCRSCQAGDHEIQASF